MIPFVVGQKVVCVNDELLFLKANEKTLKSMPDGKLDGLRKGQIYTVREVGEYDHMTQGMYIGVRLKEIFRNNNRDTPFHHTRFRPVIETDISVFHDILKSITHKRLEDA